MLYHSRKGKNDSEDDSEIIRAATPTTCPTGRAHSSCFLFSFGRSEYPAHCLRDIALAESWGGGAALGAMGLILRLSEPRGQSIEPERIILRPWNLMEFALLGVGLPWDTSPLPSFWFLSLHIICLVSQVHIWRGILPRDESYLESQPCLI